jgi:hypothetical protein
MKLIIDIPEEKYKTIQEGMYCGMLDADLYRDIKNGIPLDKLRAEISDFEEEVFQRPNTDYSDYAAVRHCLEIIDNYRGDADEVS